MAIGVQIESNHEALHANQTGMEVNSVSAETQPRNSGTLATRMLSEVLDVTGLVGFLSRQHPHSTGYHVQAATGIPAATFENWKYGRTKPNGDHVMRLLFVYGPALFRASVKQAPKWLDDAYRKDRLDRVETQLEMLLRERNHLKGARK